MSGDILVFFPGKRIWAVCGAESMGDEAKNYNRHHAIVSSEDKRRVQYRRLSAPAPLPA
jgi:hypothetical protein